MENRVQATFIKKKIPTYGMEKPMDLPFFFEKKPYQGAIGKLYPLQFNDTLTGKKNDKEYNIGVLESKFQNTEQYV
jgi:hypothetical protein